MVSLRDDYPEDQATAPHMTLSPEEQLDLSDVVAVLELIKRLTSFETSVN